MANDFREKIQQTVKGNIYAPSEDLQEETRELPSVIDDSNYEDFFKMEEALQALKNSTVE